MRSKLHSELHRTEVDVDLSATSKWRRREADEEIDVQSALLQSKIEVAVE